MVMAIPIILFRLFVITSAVDGHAQGRSGIQLMLCT